MAFRSSSRRRGKGSRDADLLSVQRRVRREVETKKQREEKRNAWSANL